MWVAAVPFDDRVESHIGSVFPERKSAGMMIVNGLVL